MADFSYANITKLVVHFVGNQAQEEGYEASQNVLTEISSELNFTLGRIFLKHLQKKIIIHLHMKQILILMRYMHLQVICLLMKVIF